MTDTALPVHVPLVREPWGILKSLNAARQNVLSIIPKIATRQPMVSGKTGKRWHMVMDPQALRHVLLDGLADYPKSDVTKNLLRPAIGESLFVAEGAHWRWQRRASVLASQRDEPRPDHDCRRRTQRRPHRGLRPRRDRHGR